jgi:hypothetical protein
MIFTSGAGDIMLAMAKLWDIALRDDVELSTAITILNPALW